MFSVTPTPGTIDARHPHPENNSAISARQGIGSPNSYTGGPEPITFTLGSTVTGAGNPLCWSVCETGIEEVKTPTAGLSPNYVQSVTQISNGVYQVLLNRPISSGQWTTITYLGGLNSVSYASVPADVNGDATSAPGDILVLIDYLNGVRSVPFGTYSCDIDHSNLCAPPDILEVIDLLNGAGTFVPWAGKGAIANSCSPSYGEACGTGEMMSGGSESGGQWFGAESSADLVSAESENEYLIDRFVEYLATADPDSIGGAFEFRIVADAIVQWCVDHFTADEQKALANRLSDPTLTFASDAGAAAAADVVAALTQ